MRCYYLLTLYFYICRITLVSSQDVNYRGKVAGDTVSVSTRSHGVPQPSHYRGSICRQWVSWNSTNNRWDDYMRKYNVVLCRRNYGNDGNCLYNAIAGVLEAHGLTRNILRFTLGHLPSSFGLSVLEHEFKEKYFTPADLRTIAAMYFVGVNPYNSAALSLWDYTLFHSKMEVAANLDTLPGYRDVKWSPKKLYHDLLNEREPLSVAREVYDSLNNFSNPLSWGSYEDIVAIASVLSLDVYLIHSNETRIQLVRGEHPTERPYPSLLLYYIDMVHFDGAGLVYYSPTGSRNILTSMFASGRIPDFIHDLAMLN